MHTATPISLAKLSSGQCSHVAHDTGPLLISSPQIRGCVQVHMDAEQLEASIRALLPQLAKSMLFMGHLQTLRFLRWSPEDKQSQVVSQVRDWKPHRPSLVAILRVDLSSLPGLLSCVSKDPAPRWQLTPSTDIQ